MSNKHINRILQHFLYCFLLVETLFCCWYPTNANAYTRTRVSGGRRNLNEIIASYFIIDAGIGYSTLLQNSPEWKIKGNIGGQLGVGYEMRIHGFWLNTGIDFQYHSYHSELTIPPDAYSAYDTQGKPFHMKFIFDKMKGEEKFIFANIPLMIGYYHRESDIYVGVGVRLGHTAFSHAKTILNYATEGEYSGYFSDFKNISTHGFNQNNEAVDKNNIGYKFRCSIIGEIGYDILAIARHASKAERNGLKLGAFVEYGLTNMVTESKNEIYYFDRIIGGEDYEYNAYRAHSIPFLVSEKAYKTKVLPLYFGIKFSWMFEMNSKRCNACW